MASANDTTTVLNAGTGGDSMDESSIYAADGVTVVGKRPRVLIGGEASRTAIVEPVQTEPAAGAYALPVRDVQALQTADQLERIAQGIDKAVMLLGLLVSMATGNEEPDEVTFDEKSEFAPQ